MTEDGRFPETRAAWRRLKRAVADCIVAYVDPEAAAAKERLALYEGLAGRWGKLTLHRPASADTHAGRQDAEERLGPKDG